MEYTPAQLEQIAARFWIKAERAENGCLEWTGALDEDGGYGMFNIGGRTFRSHRVAFWLTHGRWPEPCGLHTCDNPPCCDPSHIFEGTKAVNNADRAAKGRSSRGEAHAATVRGERNGATKLTEAQVVAIREATGPQRETALRFNISQQQVSRIKASTRWQHIS